MIDKEMKEIRSLLKSFPSTRLDELEEMKRLHWKRYAIIDKGWTKPYDIHINGLGKPVIPDQYSKIVRKHFHRIVKVVDDTCPHDTNKGCLIIYFEHVANCAICWEEKLFAYYRPFADIIKKYRCMNFTPEHISAEMKKRGYHFSPPGPDGKRNCICDKCINPEIFENLTLDAEDEAMKKWREKWEARFN